MGSEGYLVDQFLSPMTNRRDDEWGGDAERRMRFGVEVASAVRAAVGDGVPGALPDDRGRADAESRPCEEVLAFATALAAAGVDALNVGVGWHESSVPTVQGAVPAGRSSWAEGRRRSERGGMTGLPDRRFALWRSPVIAGNRLNRVRDAEAILARGGRRHGLDARPFLADPERREGARRAAR